MPFVKHVIIAAAGMGNRLGKGIPKSLVEVNNRKIIEYQLKLLEEIPYVRIVVGYMEDEVINIAKAIRPDIIFVRNPSFKKTSTLQSFYLAAKNLEERCIIMDGDTIFNEKDFYDFLSYCDDGINTIGISNRISEEPVYVDTNNIGGELEVVSFQRDFKTNYEWANIACISPNLLEYRNINVYQQLEQELPLRAFNMDRLEVDTEQDLIIASKVLQENEYVVFE